MPLERASSVRAKAGGSPERLVTFGGAGADANPSTPFRRALSIVSRSDTVCSHPQPGQDLTHVVPARLRRDLARGRARRRGIVGVFFVGVESAPFRLDATLSYLFAVIARRRDPPSPTSKPPRPCSSRACPATCPRVRASADADRAARERAQLGVHVGERAARLGRLRLVDDVAARVHDGARREVSVGAPLSSPPTAVSAAVSTNDAARRRRPSATASEEGTRHPLEGARGSCGMAPPPCVPPGGRRPTRCSPRCAAGDPAPSVLHRRVVRGGPPARRAARPRARVARRLARSASSRHARSSFPDVERLGDTATCAPPRRRGDDVRIHARARARRGRAALGGGRFSARTGAFRVAPTIARRSRDSARSSAEKARAALGATSSARRGRSGSRRCPRVRSASSAAASSSPYSCRGPSRGSSRRGSGRGARRPGGGGPSAGRGERRELGAARRESSSSLTPRVGASSAPSPNVVATSASVSVTRRFSGGRATSEGPGPGRRHEPAAGRKLRSCLLGVARASAARRDAAARAAEGRAPPRARCCRR